MLSGLPACCAHQRPAPGPDAAGDGETPPTRSRSVPRANITGENLGCEVEIGRVSGSFVLTLRLGDDAHTVCGRRWGVGGNAHRKAQKSGGD